MRAVQAKRGQARPGDGCPFSNDGLGVRGNGEGLIVASAGDDAIGSAAGGLRGRSDGKRGDDTGAREQRPFGRAILQIHIVPL